VDRPHQVPIMSLLYVPIIAAVAACLSGALVRRVAIERGAVVPPRQDRWHRDSTPTFGGLGIILNTLLSSAGLAPALYGALAVAGAFVGMVGLTGATARLIHRHLPTSESYPISRHDFAGCSGTLLLPADSSSGYAQIKDREGNVHNIQCRTTGAALPKGTVILVVEYDEDSKNFVIDANPDPPVP